MINTFLLDVYSIGDIQFRSVKKAGFREKQKGILTIGITKTRML